VLRFRDGKHASFNLMFDRLMMLEQLGLVPTPAVAGKHVLEKAVVQLARCATAVWCRIGCASQTQVEHRADSDCQSAFKFNPRIASPEDVTFA
jgi:hypothetical protein